MLITIGTQRVMHSYYKEKFDADHYWGLKG